MGTNSAKTNRQSSTTFLKSLGSNRKLGMLAFVVVFGAIAASIIFSSSAAPKPRSSGTSGPSIYVTPASQKISYSSDFTLQVWEDSLSQPVNAVQANLIYSDSAFSVVDIDSSGSAFSVQAQSGVSNGIISIGRGNMTALTGKQLVANVTLRPKMTSGKTTINFASGTILSSADTNKNILKSTFGGNYSFSR